MLNRLVAPAAQQIKNIDLVKPSAVNYANGLKSFLFHTNELELIKFEFVFENSYLPTQLPILNVALSSMLKEGTTSRTSAQIAEDIDFYGAYLMPEYSFDYTAISLYTIRKYADKVLPIVADVLMNSIFPQEELDTYIRNNKQSLQISLQKNDVLARRSFYQHLFGENQYGAVATVADYDGIKRDSLLELYKTQVKPQNCTLLIAGNIDDTLLSLVDDLFGKSWNSVDAAITNSVTLKTPAYNFFVETRDDAIQSAIRMGGFTVGRGHADYPAIQFVNTLFGGFFGSRLMRNIREDKGYTYGISSGVISLKHTAFMVLGSEVGVDVTRATVVEIEKEFRLLQEELVSSEEIDLVRNYMQGSLLGSLESIFSHVDKFKSVYFSELDLGYYNYYQDVIRTMTPAKVQDIATKYFQFDNMVKIIVGKY